MKKSKRRFPIGQKLEFALSNLCYVLIKRWVFKLCRYHVVHQWLSSQRLTRNSLFFGKKDQIGNVSRPGLCRAWSIADLGNPPNFVSQAWNSKTGIAKENILDKIYVPTMYWKASVGWIGLNFSPSIRDWNFLPTSGTCNWKFLRISVILLGFFVIRVERSMTCPSMIDSMIPREPPPSRERTWISAVLIWAIFFWNKNT